MTVIACRIGVIVRCDTDDDARVCVALGARILAHTIGDHVTGLEVAATTVPPGHMQKLYTERPLAAWCTSR